MAVGRSGCRIECLRWAQLAELHARRRLVVERHRQLRTYGGLGPQHLDRNFGRAQSSADAAGCPRWDSAGAGVFAGDLRLERPFERVVGPLEYEPAANL